MEKLHALRVLNHLQLQRLRAINAHAEEVEQQHANAAQDYIAVLRVELALRGIDMGFDFN